MDANAFLGPSGSADSTAMSRRLVIHEFMHLQECILVNGMIIDNNGNLISPQESFADYYDEVRGRKVTIVRTPGVLKLVRESFNCPTMEGMPLEVRTFLVCDKNPLRWMHNKS